MGTLSPVWAAYTRWPVTSSWWHRDKAHGGAGGHMGQCHRHIMSCVLACSSWVVLVCVCPSDVITVHCQLFDGEQNDDTSLIWAPHHWAATAQFLPEPHTPSTLGSISSTASCNPTQNIAKVYLNQRENHQSKDGVDIFQATLMECLTCWAAWVYFLLIFDSLICTRS